VQPSWLIVPGAGDFAALVRVPINPILPRRRLKTNAQAALGDVPQEHPDLGMLE